jgi:hypothetical protein
MKLHFTFLSDNLSECLLFGMDFRYFLKQK